MAEYYKIKGETLTAIADAIRGKKETTAFFSPEQMAAEIKSLAMGNDLQNAEDYTFGLTTGYEHGIVNGTIGNTESSLHWGRKFTVNVAISFTGFRLYPFNTIKDHILTLWDAETKEVLERMTIIPTVTEEWVDYVLTEPRNLTPGKTYMLGFYTQGHYKVFDQNTVEYNPKIAVTGNFYGYSASSYPSTAVSSYATYDMLIGEVLGESVVKEYKIQTETMNGIADEIRRIGGVTDKISPAQMLTTLQSIQLQDKSITPTAEVQTITPDDGYSGLSSVTVGAITEENEAVIEIINENMEVVANDTY